MPSERIQRRIDALLDEADGAFAVRDWARLATLADDVLKLDQENADARAAGAVTGSDKKREPRNAQAISPLPSSPIPVTIAPVASDLSSGLPVVDLFAGAGGLSLGAQAAGLSVRLAIDLDPRACETLCLNERADGAKTVEADVSTLRGSDLRRLANLGPAEPLVVIGGAPCQPFSKAAYWIDPGDEAAYRRARARGEALSRPAPPAEPKADDRRSLVDEFARLVVEARAEAFLFENVPSIMHPRNVPVLRSLIGRLEAAGFAIVVARANAAEFGVAQKRERVFVLGSTLKKPIPPVPTHHLSAAATLWTKKAITAGEALADITPETPFEPEEVIAGRWAQHLAEIPPGWNYKAHTAWAGHASPTFVTETRFWNFLLKLSPDQPSWTIPASPGPWTGPFHWDTRRLRTPELAALQGFPPGYAFSGTRRDRVRLIGNAVPPPLAAAMLTSLADSMSKCSSRSMFNRALPVGGARDA
jgi:DNA (cytosine-5)-methyltransferase 1